MLPAVRSVLNVSLQCDQDCLEEALIEDSLFYPIATVRPPPCPPAASFNLALRAQNLYNNLTYMYPESNIWIIGHSLGGAIGSLLGATFGAPVVAFEAPGDRMASQRLHLPQPVRLPAGAPAPPRMPLAVS